MRIPLLLIPLLCCSLEAAIIFSGTKSIAVPQDFNGIFINLETGNVLTSDDTFVGSQFNSFFGGAGIATSELLLPARTGTENLDPILNLTPGTPVDDSLLFSSGTGGSSTHVGNDVGQFSSGSQGYIGFRFDPQDDGLFSYGWMKVTLTNGSTQGVIHEWAYQSDPDTPITVGLIPEASSSWTTSLLILILSTVLLRHR